MGGDSGGPFWVKENRDTPATMWWRGQKTLALSQPSTSTSSKKYASIVETPWSVWPCEGNLGKHTENLPAPYEHYLNIKDCISRSIGAIQNLFKSWIFRIYIVIFGFPVFILLTSNFTKNQKLNPISSW